MLSNLKYWFGMIFTALLARTSMSRYLIIRSFIVIFIYGPFLDVLGLHLQMEGLKYILRILWCYLVDFFTQNVFTVLCNFVVLSWFLAL